MNIVDQNEPLLKTLSVATIENFFSSILLLLITASPFIAAAQICNGNIESILREVSVSNPTNVVDAVDGTFATLDSQTDTLFHGIG